MLSRRFFVLVSLVTTAVCFFLLGVFHARTDDAVERAVYDAKLDAIRAEVQRDERNRAQTAEVLTTGTTGDVDSIVPGLRPARTDRARAKMVADIKRELSTEMGLLPLQ